MDLPFESSPAELLAWDDAFLEETEETGRSFLWFWESPVPFVVVGYGQQRDDTVDVGRCLTEGIPILRRRSGGGTVVQGPGCLTYGITLPIASHPALARVDSTNRWIMEFLARALEKPTGLPVGIDGHTDLTLAGPGVRRKFSGNAQRRTRTAILFHGTFLYGVDLQQIDRLLKLPEDRPAYRGSRSHLDFLTLLPLPPTEIRMSIIAT
ncbi:MAG: biotin/lipoate A/B protein ligase family protein, partial [Verrucomicrobiota bacterium]